MGMEWQLSWDNLGPLCVVTYKYTDMVRLTWKGLANLFLERYVLGPHALSVPATFQVCREMDGLGLTCILRRPFEGSCSICEVREKAFLRWAAAYSQYAQSAFIPVPKLPLYTYVCPFLQGFS